MLRKTTILSLLAVLSACGGSQPQPTPQAPVASAAPSASAAPTPTVASDTSKTPTTDASTASAAPVAFPTSIESFNADLYAKLKANKGNVFYSPASIELALAMTAAGAKGTTLSQMQTVLHLPADQTADNQAAAALLAAWANPQPKGPTLSVANRLWGQQGYPFQPDYLQITNKSFGAELGVLDFKKSAEPSRSTINTWVSDKTNHKIPELLPSGSVTAQTKLVLTNAVYFKGAWKTAFSKTATKTESFKTSAATIKVPMMHETLNASYADVGHAEALDLPYGGGFLSMVIVLPKAGQSIANVESDLDGGAITKWTKAFSIANVNVSLPRFKTSAAVELSNILSQMGMPSAFGGDADFSGISQKGQEPLFISAVIHKAFVDVNEEGTEAAAATGVVMRPMSAVMAPPKTIDFKVDHAFLFFIRDNSNGTILFSGRIDDPTK